jgi:hypothetical protein
MLEVVFLYLGTGVACFNAASFLRLHPLTWDWVSLWIILYCCSIFFSNGIYGIKLVLRKLSLKFAHSSRQQKVYLIIGSVLLCLLSCIFQLAPLYLILEDFNFQKERRCEKVTFSHLCQDPGLTCEKRRKLVETYKKRRQLDVHWKAFQKLRADYYLWDQIMENFPQLILFMNITNANDFKNIIGPASLMLTLYLWAWQRFLGYTCTVEDPHGLIGQSDLPLFFAVGCFLHAYLLLGTAIFGFDFAWTEITSALTFSSELQNKHGKIIPLSHNFVYYMSSFSQLDLPLTAVLHFGGVAWINSDLGWTEKAKEALATILIPLPHRDWIIPQGEPQRKTKMECLQDFLQFKRKLIALTLLQICKIILVFFPKVICDIILLIYPLYPSSWKLNVGAMIWLFALSFFQLSHLYWFYRLWHPSSMLLPSPPDFVIGISVFSIVKLLMFLFSDEEAKYVDQKEECRQVEEETSIEMQSISSTATCLEANGLNTSDTIVVESVVDCPSSEAVM